ncbi:MAG: hypothetical protein LBQ22_00495 [Bacteroidales bacterium]|jgi:hypothetical protein|nr:hypothetical protein [Bacteroidales bacterium]
MKKLSLTVCGTVFCFAVLFMNVSIDKGTSSKDIKLKELSLSADIYAASCPEGPLPSGKCSTFSGHCYGNPGGPWNCDITVWNPW